MNKIFSTLSKSFQFEGRSSRSEYWVFFVFCLTFAGAGLGIDFMFDWYDPELGLGLISGVLLVFLFFPSLSVSIRRLHDTDKTGWVYLGNFIPVVGPLLMIFFMAQKGTQGDNRFGADPYASESDAEVPLAQ
jgi:uncharacterized membrane protein YhaH (DUF805 family)